MRTKKAKTSDDLQAKPAGAVTPEPVDAGELMMLKLAHIRASATNPRKTFTGIEELAASIRNTGLHQPVVVRPADAEPGATAVLGIASYELVFGERRMRAAKLAGLLEIPAIVRTMTDAQVREAQLIENNQRQDVNPMEEAIAFQNAIEACGYSMATIAAKIGRDARYVQQRLALLRLIPELQELAHAGKLPLLHGAYIARYGVNAQKELLKQWDWKDHKSEDWHAPKFGSGEYVGWRNHLSDCEREMKAAPFDLADAELLPGVGACTSCQNRSANNPGLFDDDAPAGDRCMNGPCFERKIAALLKRTEREIKAENLKYVKIATPHKGATELGWDEERKAEKQGVLKPDQYEIISLKEAKKMPPDQVATALVTAGARIGERVIVKLPAAVAEKVTEAGTVAKDETPAAARRFRSMEARREEAQT